MNKNTTKIHNPTQKQLDDALQRALDECGFTHQQLEEQALAGKFESELARRTWFCLPRFNQLRA